MLRKLIYVYIFLPVAKRNMCIRKRADKVETYVLRTRSCFNFFTVKGRKCAATILSN